LVCLKRRKNRMAEESSQSISQKRLKGFVRNLCIVAKKHKDREEARAGLQGQIKRLKRFSSKKKEMDEELRELDRKVSLVLEKEKGLSGVNKGESAASKRLMKNVIENKDRIKQMNDSISDIKQRMEEYINFKTARNKKIQELEKKIRTKSGAKSDVSSLRKKLKSLESLYDKLKQKGVDVSRVSSKIEDLKLRLDFA